MKTDQSKEGGPCGLNQIRPEKGARGPGVCKTEFLQKKSLRGGELGGTDGRRLGLVDGRRGGRDGRNRKGRVQPNRQGNRGREKIGPKETFEEWVGAREEGGTERESCNNKGMKTLAVQKEDDCRETIRSIKNAGVEKPEKEGGESDPD